MAANAKVLGVDETLGSGKSRTRSPGYPFINLETALKRAQEFFAIEMRNSANLRVAVRHWNYEEKSSGGLQTAAALIAFGLMKDEGSGAKRKLQLTPNAIRILLDKRPDSIERAELIKQAALTPKIHRDLWKKWGISRPSDDQFRYTLIAEWEPPFNENVVDSFIRQYKDTIAFAKLTESDKLASEDGDNAEAGDGSNALKVGDFVQWESKGTEQFPVPKRVRELTPDGKYAIVEGSYTGLPIEQLTRVRAPLGALQAPESRDSASPNKQMQEFVVPLSDGNRAVFQWPTMLSKDDIDDLKDSLQILERKIMRSKAKESNEAKSK